MTRSVSRHSEGRSDAIALLLLMALAAAIRLFWIEYPALWMDEIFTYVYARESYAHHFALDRTTDLHPPLHVVMLKAWMTVFGDSRTAMRSLSVLFGVFTLPALYLIAQSWTTKRVAVIACLFLALNPLNIHFSREARAYAALSFFLLWATYFFLALIREGRGQSKRIGWYGGGFAFCLAATFHLHYVAVLFFPLFGLAALLVSWPERDWRLFIRLIGATAAAAILCLPQSVHFLGYATSPEGSARNSWMSPTSWSVFYTQTLAAYPFPSFSKLLVVPAYIFGFWRLWQHARPLFTVALVFVIVAPLVLAVIGFVRPLYLVRTIQAFTLLSPLLIGVALAGLPNRMLAGAVALLAAVHIWAMAPSYPSHRLPNPGELIKQALVGKEGNIVYFDANLERELLAYHVDLDGWRPIDFMDARSDAPEVARHLADCAGRTPRCPSTSVIIEHHPPHAKAAALAWTQALDKLATIHPTQSDELVSRYRIITFR